MNLPLHRLIRHNGHKKSKGRTKGQVKEKRKGGRERREECAYHTYQRNRRKRDEKLTDTYKKRSGRQTIECLPDLFL